MHRKATEKTTTEGGGGGAKAAELLSAFRKLARAGSRAAADAMSHIRPGEGGCCYCGVGGGWHAVAASSDDGEGWVMKLARNCDDLQCDYFWDWESPTDPETGDAMPAEVSWDAGSEASPREIGEAFANEALCAFAALMAAEGGR